MKNFDFWILFLAWPDGKVQINSLQNEWNAMDLLSKTFSDLLKISSKQKYQYIVGQYAELTHPSMKTEAHSLKL